MIERRSGFFLDRSVMGECGHFRDIHELTLLVRNLELVCGDRLIELEDAMLVLGGSGSHIKLFY